MYKMHLVRVVVPESKEILNTHTYVHTYIHTYVDVDMSKGHRPTERAASGESWNSLSIKIMYWIITQNIG